MSPPIFNPDGSEVSEIVLPDGSTASQVIGPDGNVVFEAGPDIPDSGVHYYAGEGNTLYYYSLSTAYDLTTKTQEDTLGPFSSATIGITVSYEGDYVFVLDAEVDDLFYRYDLSTPYDLSTATEAQSVSFTYGDFDSGCIISKDGKTIWVGNSGPEIATYSLSTAFDLQTLTQEKVNSMPVPQEDPSEGDGIGTFAFNQDGTKMYYGIRNSSYVYEAELSTAFDVETASVTANISTADDSIGVAMSFDGTKLYTTHYSPDDVYEYNLNTAFDLSTADSGTSQYVKADVGTSIAFNLPPRYA